MICDTCTADRAHCACYYIFSLTWNRGEAFLTWWGRDNSGYVTQLANAGRYAKERVEGKRGYYDNRDSTIAIPCVKVDREAVLVVPDHALRRLLGDVTVRPVIDNREADACPDCGQHPPNRVMGLEVVKS